MNGQGDHHGMAESLGASDFAGSPHCELRSDGTGLRLSYRPPYGEGGADLYSLNPDLLLALGNFRCHGRGIDSNVARDLVKIHVQLKGRAAFGSGRREFQVTGMSAGLLLHPQGFSKTEHYPAAERQHSVTLFCAPDYLREMLRDVAHRLPGELRAALFAPVMDFAYFDLPLRHEMVLAAEALLYDRGDPGLARLRLEAKALELLYEFLTGMRAADQQLAGADRERAAAAREYLERHYAAPPTTAELARRLGTNEARLADSFKRQYGLTIFDYLQKVRIDHACNLLRHSDLSITQVALELGYEHPGNFTTAFKRHMGMTPRAFRRT